MDFQALERLGRLRDSQAISEVEFQAEKRRILGVASSSAQADAPPTRNTPTEDSRPDLVSSGRTPLKVRTIILLLGISAAIIVCGTATYYYLRQRSYPTDSVDVHTLGYALHSRVKGIRIAPTTKLPANPHQGDTSCSAYEHTPTSGGAKLVQSKGWHVISDFRVGQFNAVSFVGACEPISASAFRAVDGNIGMYEGIDLRAVIYGKRVGFSKSADDPMQLQITNETNEPFARVTVTSRKISVLN